MKKKANNNPTNLSINQINKPTQSINHVIDFNAIY